jgi:hypothetical protein
MKKTIRADCFVGHKVPTSQLQINWDDLFEKLLS